MQFQTHYERTRSAPEKNSGICKVDRAGYISSQKRIENLINAGMRLVESRREQYDFPGNEFDPDFEDPTRSKNFDMADASQMDYAVKERMAAAARNKAVQEQAAKASQSAQEARIEHPEQEVKG